MGEGGGVLLALSVFPEGNEGVLDFCRSALAPFLGDIKVVVRMAMRTRRGGVEGGALRRVTTIAVDLSLRNPTLLLHSEDLQRRVLCSPANLKSVPSTSLS